MKLILTDDQAQTIIRALDLYSRLGCGQFAELPRLFQFDPRNRIGLDWSAIERQLDAIKSRLLPFLGRGVSYSICSHEVPNDYRSAYDMLQVIRHDLAWRKNPEGGITVDFHEPMKTSNEPLCRVET